MGWRLALAAASLLTLAACAAMPSPPPDQATELDLSIFNGSDYPIFVLQVASETSAYWSEDILGPEILYPGEGVTVILPVTLTCIWNVRSVDEFSETTIHVGVDVCRTEAIAIQ